PTGPWRGARPRWTGWSPSCAGPPAAPSTILRRWRRPPRRPSSATDPTRATPSSSTTTSMWSPRRSAARWCGRGDWTSVLDEIHEQPAAVDRMLERNSGLVADLASLTEGATHVVIAARGTSDNAARYAQYVWGARNRLVVGLTTPSLFGPLQSPPDLTGALVVGISQSGQSPDLVEVLAEAVRQGRPTLAITNDPASPLASRAGCVMDLAAGPERGIPATKTYTTQLAAVALASLAFAGDDMEPLACLPDRLQEALDRATDLEAAVDVLADAERCAVVGRGYHISTVFEWALKLQEMAYLVAQPFSAADFLHGPVAVVDEGFP